MVWQSQWSQLSCFCSAGAGRKKEKTFTINDFEFNEDEEGEDCTAEAEGEEEEEDDDLDIEEEDSNSKPSPKQVARKKALQAKKEANDVEELTEKVSTMTVQSKPYDMSIRCPYIMCDYVEHSRDVVSVDFLVPNQHRRFFRLEIRDNKQLALVVVVPSIFYQKLRPLAHAESQGNKKFNKNTAKNTAFTKVCEKIIEECGTTIVKGDEEEEIEVYEGEQIIELPFEVEEVLWQGPKGDREGFEIVAAESEDDVLFSELGEVTDQFVLSVDCVVPKKEKKKKARGTMAKLESPTKGHVDSDEEEEAEEEGMDE